MIIPYLVFVLVLHWECVEGSDDINEHLPKPVIGAYFSSNSSLRRAFSLAVHTVNKCMYDHEICEIIQPTPDDINRRLFHQVEFTAIAVEAADDAIGLYKQFGELAYVSNKVDYSVGNYDGLAVVIGPHARIPSMYLQGLCDIHDIPHIAIRRELDFDNDFHRSLNFYPDTETLAKVYIEMLGKLNWSDFTILYERTENLLALDNVLKMYPLHSHRILTYKLGSGRNFTETLLEAKASGDHCFLIDCGFNILSDVLKQAQQVGMMTESYKYVVTTLDLHAFNLYPYQYSGVNITGLQFVDVDNPFVREFVSQHLDELGIDDVKRLRVKDAVIFDAVVLFAQAYKDLNYRYASMQRGALLPHKYDQETLWKDGLSLRNYMLATETMGLTGPVMLDGDGVRRRFKLDVVNLHQTGLTRVGEWNFEDGFSDLNLLKAQSRIHYNVLISLTPPFAFQKNYSSNLEGNDRYEGFVVDLIDKLSTRLNFDYTLHVQVDGNNGNCTLDDKSQKCECVGIMKKMLTNEMDLAIADLTITEDRQKCVQFSTAFMSLGISILFKKPQKAESKWHSFFAPFDYKLWLAIALTYFLMGLLFYFFGRMCPAEWTNPYPCIDEPDHLENQFTIANALWFSMGSKMQQGSEIMPFGLSTRVLAGWWWFFCLIIVNTYIANLVAFLTIEKPVVLLNSVDELMDQTEIKYGAKEGGSTLQYFKNSQKYRKLYDQMMENDWKKKYIVKNNNEGVKLAKSEDMNYAYFMESASIEYEIKRNCELQQTGKLLDQKIYAIAYARNFTAQVDFDLMLSKLQESLEIKDLKDKWWNMKGAVCGEEKKGDSAAFKRLTLEQMKGIFYVLGVGLLLSLMQTIYEFVQHIRSISKTSELGFWKIAKIELRLISKSKPIKPVLSKQISMETDSMGGYSNNLTITTHA